MLYKEEIYNELTRINKLLRSEDLYLNLKVVGGAALIFNGIEAVSTDDVDTINKLEYQVKEIIEECSLDINDDALDYIENYDGLEFIYDDKKSFSNISIEYLSLGGVIITKMKDTDVDKLTSLKYLLEDELEVNISPEGISTYLRELGEIPNQDDIENFLKETQYT